MKLNLGFTSGLLLLFFGSIAQNSPEKVWTIDECVSYARQNNIQVRQAALQADMNSNNLQSARWDYAPNLNFNSSYGWNFGLNIDPVTNTISQSQRQTANLNLSSNWVLYSGGRKYNTIAQRNLDYMAGMYDLEQVKNDISLNVASFYLQILLNQEILAVAKEQLRVTQLQLNRTTKLVDAGAAPKGDQLQLEAQLARDQQNIIAAENSVTISKLQLANLLQLENPDEFTISNPDLEVPEAALIARGPDGIFQSAVENQPAIKSAEVKLESSEKAVALSKGAALPTLSVNGQIGTSYSDQIQEAGSATVVDVPVATYDQNGTVVFIPRTQVVPGDFNDKSAGDQLGDNLNEYVGLSLSIPIFNRMSVRNNYQNAQIGKELSQLQLDQEKNNLRQTIYQAHADAKASYNSYLAAEKAVESSEESFKYSNQRFEVGALNQFDFENAKNSLAVAQSEMIRSKYDYIFKIKVLEFYLTNQVKL
jgi:outer membrane protein